MKLGFDTESEADSGLEWPELDQRETHIEIEVELRQAVGNEHRIAAHDQTKDLHRISQDWECESTLILRCNARLFFLIGIGIIQIPHDSHDGILCGIRIGYDCLITLSNGRWRQLVVIVVNLGSKAISLLGEPEIAQRQVNIRIVGCSRDNGRQLSNQIHHLNERGDRFALRTAKGRERVDQ